MFVYSLFKKFQTKCFSCGFSPDSGKIGWLCLKYICIAAIQTSKQETLSNIFIMVIEFQVIQVRKKDNKILFGINSQTGKVYSSYVYQFCIKFLKLMFFFLIFYLKVDH